jgi:DNA-3-methyladenine glycosylase
LEHADVRFFGPRRSGRPGGAGYDASPDRSPAIPAPRPLTHADLPHDTTALARALIGLTLAHETAEGLVRARIVETEAYPPGDEASHAFRGPTPRNRPMFGPPGHAYVYRIYGVWLCLNVGSEADGVGGGVLFRAAEPLEGLDLMRARRGRPGEDAGLLRGPGLMARALGVTLADSGADMLDGGALRLEAAVRPAGEIGVSTRIGLTRAAERPLRLFERGSASVSGPRRLNL